MGIISVFWYISGFKDNSDGDFAGIDLLLEKRCLNAVYLKFGIKLKDQLGRPDIIKCKI